MGTILAFLPMVTLVRGETPTVAVLAFLLFSGGFAIVSRLALRFHLREVRLHGRNLSHVILVGANERSACLAAKLMRHPDLGYRILGFVGDDWDGAEFVKESNCPILGGLHAFKNILRENVVDEVIISLPLVSNDDRAQKIALACEEQGIVVRVLVDGFQLSRFAARTDKVEGTLLVTFSSRQDAEWMLILKSLIDRATALILMLFTLPLWILIAAAIKITMPGPVFFVHDRVGYKKRRFRFFKFRTMVVDAEARVKEIAHLNEVKGAAFKIRHDPRVTPLGRFLRRTSLDELPQLVNVLRGDMSMVGPRPLPVRDWLAFEQYRHQRRFSVRPGISCLWQVSGRHQLTFEEWMELDMRYIDEWSLWLDLKILLKTVGPVLRGTGAS